MKQAASSRVIRDTGKKVILRITDSLEANLV